MVAWVPAPRRDMRQSGRLGHEGVRRPERTKLREADAYTSNGIAGHSARFFGGGQMPRLRQ